MQNMMTNGLGGSFPIFMLGSRFLPYLTGFLLAAVIALWIFYGRSKTKGFLIAAIIVTVLFLIIAAFNFLPNMALGLRGGREMQFREFDRPSNRKDISSIGSNHPQSYANNSLALKMFYIK